MHHRRGGQEDGGVRVDRPVGKEPAGAVGDTVQSLLQLLAEPAGVPIPGSRGGEHADEADTATAQGAAVQDRPGEAVRDPLRPHQAEQRACVRAGGWHEDRVQILQAGACGRDRDMAESTWMRQRQGADEAHEILQRVPRDIREHPDVQGELLLAGVSGRITGILDIEMQGMRRADDEVMRPAQPPVRVPVLRGAEVLCARVRILSAHLPEVRT